MASNELDLLAASIRADLSDLDAFLEGLAAKLEQAMPAQVRVQRGRGGLRRPRRVQRIELDAGGRRLELRRSGGSIETWCSHLSGGIVIKRELVGIDDWITALSELVAAEARRSATTRQALERLLTG